MAFFGCVREADLKSPPSLSELVESEQKDHREQMRYSSLDPLLELSKGADTLPDVLAASQWLVGAPPADAKRMKLPNPMGFGLRPTGVFEMVGIVRAAGPAADRLNLNRWYRDGQVWRVRSENLGAALEIADRRVRELSEEVIRTVPLDAISRLTSGSAGSRPRTAEDALIEYVLDGRTKPAHEREYVFWLVLAKSIRSVSRRGLDLILPLPGPIYSDSSVETGFIEWDEVSRALADSSGAEWNRLFERAVAGYRKWLEQETEQEIKCPVERFRLLAKYRRLPLVEFDGSLELTALSYLAKEARLSPEPTKLADGYSGFLSIVPRNQVEPFRLAIKRVMEGELNESLLAETDLEEITADGGREGLDSLLTDVGRAVLKVLDRFVKTPGLVVGTGDCRGSHPTQGRA